LENFLQPEHLEDTEELFHARYQRHSDK